MKLLRTLFATATALSVLAAIGCTSQQSAPEPAQAPMAPPPPQMVMADPRPTQPMVQNPPAEVAMAPDSSATVARDQTTMPASSDAFTERPAQADRN
jgi:hypothetical protein